MIMEGWMDDANNDAGMECRRKVGSTRVGKGREVLGGAFKKKE